MINDIKLKLYKHRALISNFNFMSILQVSQILFPLAIYPYLIRTLGKDTYGLIAYSNAVAAYFLLLINFGFNISEIKEIAVNRDDIKKVSEIVSSVLVIRLALFLTAIFILGGAVVLIPALNSHKWLYFAYSGILLNGAIDPSFYFQGIEKMKFTTVISVVSNLVFLLLIILFVKDEPHYMLVPLLTGIGGLLGSAVGLYFVFFVYKVRFTLRPYHELKAHFMESIPFFSSRISVLVIDKANIVLIGSFIGYSQVAYYDLAVKLVMALKVPFQIFNQVLFPNVSRTGNTSLVIKTLRILLVVYVIGYCFLYLFGEPVIKIIGGLKLIPAKYVLYLLGITTVTELVSTFMGAPMLLAKGHKTEYNKSILYGCIFYVLIITTLYLGKWIGLYPLTIATICTGSFIMLYRLYYCRLFKLI